MPWTVPTGSVATRRTAVTGLAAERARAPAKASVLEISASLARAATSRTRISSSSSLSASKSPKSERIWKWFMKPSLRTSGSTRY